MRIRRALSWRFSQQFGQYGLQFISSIVIARLLTPDEMGVFALAMAANFLISSLRDFGVGSYIVREENLTDDKIRTAFGIWIVVSWSLGLGVLLARHYVADLYDTPGIADVMLLLCVSFFVAPLGQPVQALLHREMRFDILHHIALATTTVAMVTSIVLAVLGFSYMALAWGMITGTVLRAIALVSVRPDHIKMLPSFRHWRDVIRFGGMVAACSLIGTVNTEGIKFILGGFISPAAVAFYERAVQLPAVSRQALFMPLGTVLFPAFSKSIREGVTIGPAVVNLIAATTVIIWPAFLTMSFIAQPIVVFLFGENWRVAGEILPYILLSHAITATLPQPFQILVPHGKVGVLFGLVLFGTVNNLAAVAIGAMHSLEWFAYLQPVQAAMFIVVSYFCQRRYWQADVRQVLMSYVQALIVALVASLPGAAAFFTYGIDMPTPILLAVMVAAPIIWVAMIFILRHYLSREVLFIAKKARTYLVSNTR